MWWSSIDIKDNYRLDQDPSAFMSVNSCILEILSGDVQEEWVNRTKIGTTSTVLEQKEAEGLHTFQLAIVWVTSSKPQKEIASEVAGLLHRIHCQIFQEVIQPEDSKEEETQ